MVGWAEFVDESPELAAAIGQRFEAQLHHVLATIRRDGGPRLSGTEVRFHAGHVWLGMMPQSRKAADLRRDARFAIHSSPVDVELAEGDARVGGRAVEVRDTATKTAFAGSLDSDTDVDEMVLFRLDLDEAVLTRVRRDRLLIDLWRPGESVRHFERR